MALPFSFNLCCGVPPGGDSVNGPGAGAGAALGPFGLSLMLAYQDGQHKRSNHTTSADCALQKKKRNTCRKVCKIASQKRTLENSLVLQLHNSLVPFKY